MRRGVVLLALAGCGPAVLLPDAGDDGEETSTSGVASSSTSGIPMTTTSSTAASTVTGPTDTSGEGTTAVESGGFIEPGDYGGDGECSIWEEDCPKGEKCMPWANDGGNSWNATKCVPIVDDPGAPGDPCSVEESGVSGIDDCEKHAMCWDVDPGTLMGTCVAFCVGSEAEPTCEDPTTRCSQANSGVLILCLPVCDPIAQDCADGAMCAPNGEDFACLEPGTTQVGEPCEYIDVCAAGLVCMPADSVPGCEDVGCCSAFCALNDPDPPCAEGQSCIAWYEPGKAPPPYENVGVCAVPK